MGRISYSDLDYVNVIAYNEMAIYGGLNWGNLFKSVFTYVPLNINFSNWGWNFGVTANSSGVGVSGSSGNFNFGFSFSF